MGLDGARVGRGVITEPGSVSGLVTRETCHVGVGISSIVLGVGGGGVELRLHGRRATDEGGPLFVGTGDGEATREFNLGSVPNVGEQILGGAIGIDVGEEVRWLDGVVSSASSSEAVCAGD